MAVLNSGVNTTVVRFPGCYRFSLRRWTAARALPIGVW